MTDRVTLKNLRNGAYEHAEHHRLSDRAMRRYHPYSFDFDSTPLSLDEPGEHWDEGAKANHLAHREQAIERLRAEYGQRNIDTVVTNVRELGAKGMSLITYHNQMHEQARRAFVVGAYYPAIVAACALGERILNHLIIDLRGSFRASPHYKKIYRKDSFDYWPYAVEVLRDWQVFAAGVSEDFLALAEVRNRSIHFDPKTYSTLREDALSALKLLGGIISKQFGYFGRQPWFIEKTAGACFIKRDYEAAPFVRHYLIPRSGFIGPLYGMELSPDGFWRHLDWDDYGDGNLQDDAWAKAHTERDPAMVVTREMIERSKSGVAEEPPPAEPF